MIDLSFTEEASIMLRLPYFLCVLKCEVPGVNSEKNMLLAQMRKIPCLLLILHMNTDNEREFLDSSWGVLSGRCQKSSQRHQWLLSVIGAQFDPFDPSKWVLPVEKTDLASTIFHPNARRGGRGGGQAGECCKLVHGEGLKIILEKVQWSQKASSGSQEGSVVWNGSFLWYSCQGKHCGLFPLGKFLPALKYWVERDISHLKLTTLLCRSSK